MLGRLREPRDVPARAVLVKRWSSRPTWYRSWYRPDVISRDRRSPAMAEQAASGTCKIGGHRPPKPGGCRFANPARPRTATAWVIRRLGCALVSALAGAPGPAPQRGLRGTSRPTSSRPRRTRSASSAETSPGVHPLASESMILPNAASTGPRVLPRDPRGPS
jgi:hypothetical protein